MTVPDPDGGKTDFYVRQLWNGKGSIDLDTITPDGLIGFSAVCAWLLAHTHAKTGDRHAIAAYLGKGSAFDDAMVHFANQYADQNEADYQMFVQAVAEETKKEPMKKQ